MSEIIAYQVADASGIKFEPAATSRVWMDHLPQQFAKRCLPLLMANQSGWVGVLQGGFMATWNGGSAPGDVVVIPHGPHPVNAVGHFGHGILTFTMPYLFRTPPGVNMLVRGPSNAPRDGIYALEGLVETDWSDSTFTMNWQFTRPGAVSFRPGDPVVMIVPQQRNDLESYECRIAPISEAPDLQAGYNAWAQGRSDFSKKLKSGDPETVAQGWQKDYFRGKDQNGDRHQEHQSKRTLQEFS